MPAKPSVVILNIPSLSSCYPPFPRGCLWQSCHSRDFPFIREFSDNKPQLRVVCLMLQMHLCRTESFVLDEQTWLISVDAKEIPSRTMRQDIFLLLYQAKLQGFHPMSLNWIRINLMNSKSRWKWFISQSEALKVTLHHVLQCPPTFWYIKKKCSSLFLVFSYQVNIITFKKYLEWQDQKGEQLRMKKNINHLPVS